MNISLFLCKSDTVMIWMKGCTTNYTTSGRSQHHSCTHDENPSSCPEGHRHTAGCPADPQPSSSGPDLDPGPPPTSWMENHLKNTKQRGNVMHFWALYSLWCVTHFLCNTQRDLHRTPCPWSKTPRHSFGLKFCCIVTSLCHTSLWGAGGFGGLKRQVL